MTRPCAGTTTFPLPNGQMPAMALNSVNMNIARVLGPAIGGLIVIAIGKQYFYAGKGAAFLGTALSLSGVIWVLARWRFCGAGRMSTGSQRRRDGRGLQSSWL